MKLSDMKEGMKLRCIGNYADCIHEGKEYEVKKVSEELCIMCDEGEHELSSTATDDGELPEFEPLDE